MEGERKHGDLQILLEVIKSSNVLEDRVALIRELGECYVSETYDLALAVECLPTFWDESTCSGISQCMLNKEILHLAAKYLELQLPHCITHFVVLGTKVGLWCVKHLEIMIASAEGDQKEAHQVLFLQLVLDSLGISSSIILSLTESPLLEEKTTLLIVENFVLQQMNLIKTCISEIKTVHSIGSSFLKVMPVILDSLMKLSKSYSEVVKHDNFEICKDDTFPVDGGLNSSLHAVNINISIIKGLYELGILAASGGGNLVTVLNSSWKGVVTLLRLAKWNVTDKIDIGDIILTLVSLATDSLRCVVETWTHAFKEGQSLTLSEAKKSLFLVKFYLVNAVRISSEYPCEALNASIGLTKCVLMITSVVVSFSKENHLKAASEALSVVLQPTSFLLLHTIFDSNNVQHDCKLQILDSLFPCESCSVSPLFEKLQNTTSSSDISSHLLDYDDMNGMETLTLGRVMLFLNLLKTSVLLREEMLFEISKKLEYLFSCLSDENIYSCVILLHIPVLSASGATTSIGWQPLLAYLLHVLQTFMIVASASVLTWSEVETFLISNVFHPHVICIEIVLELWCFLIRRAKKDMMEDALDSLCSLLKAVALSQPALTPFSALRRIARFISTIACCAPQATADHVYNSVLANDKFDLSSASQLAMLMEGFPLNLISEDLRNPFIQRILNTFLQFMEDNDGRLTLLDSFQSSESFVLGLPVHTLSHAVHCCKISIHDDFYDDKVYWLLKFAVSLIREYPNVHKRIKDQYVLLLSAILHVISDRKHLFPSDEMGKLILELRTMFLGNFTVNDNALYKCKAPLTSFMAGLGEMEIEGISSNIFSLLCDLYHMLLKERHWASVHLSLTAFGYFTSCTSCNELWKFVPHDAALSFDKETGSETSEERFMAEFKAFLEKETSIDVFTPCKEQLDILANEGALLRKRLEKIKISHCSVEMPESESMDIDDKQVTRKKRKLPDGISEGLALLQSGLKTLTDVFACNDTGELKERFCNHLSCIEETLSQLFSLSTDE